MAIDTHRSNDGDNKDDNNDDNKQLTPFQPAPADRRRANQQPKALNMTTKNNNNDDQILDDDEDDNGHDTTYQRSNRTSMAVAGIRPLPWPTDRNTNCGKDPNMNMNLDNSGGNFGGGGGCCYAVCHTVRRQWDAWTFAYMNPIFTKGAKQEHDQPQNKNSGDSIHHTQLTHADIYAAPQAMEAARLANQFRTHYHAHQGHSRQIYWTLWKLAVPTFVPAGICELIAIFCQVAMPLLVRQLLQILEDHPHQQVLKQGLPYALSIFCSLVLNAFCTHRHRHLSMMTGVLLRSAVVTVLYDHVLRLTPQGRTGLTSGQITNLIAVDAQKVYEVCQEGHLTWSLPLAVVLVTGCLVYIMGPATLMGIAVLILFVPLVKRVTGKMLQIRQARVAVTDRRIQVVNTMLQGIKTTKLNNYETNYEQRIIEARAQELVFLRSEQAVWALTLCVIVSSPILASASTFAVYVLVDENHTLTAATTFSVLLLFSALRFPINYAAQFMGKATQAISALRRISKFLEREVSTVESSAESRSNQGELADPPLRLEHASFQIGTQGDGGKAVDAAVTVNVDDPASELSATFRPKPFFRVSQFDLTVQRGEVVAICGPVGCGKSTLINGIIGEVEASLGSLIQLKGTVSYVPQTPFILNTTLRDNILFGRAFDSKLYDRVLDACCLRLDIEQLGKHKDLTEIGERGVTLSGGQKQRVALARAAYAQADLVLMDDPLSALDAGTAKTVFERLIKSGNAFFCHSAVVLVTHASHFINRVDRVLIIVDGENKFLGTWPDLLTFIPPDTRTQRAIEHLRRSVQEDGSEQRDDASDGEDDATKKSGEDVRGVLMTIEEREHGISSVRTWLLWFQRAGGAYFLLLQILFMSIDRFAYVAVEYWLARWTDAADKEMTIFGINFPSQTDGRSAQSKYIIVYALLVLVSVIATVIRSEWAVTGGTRAAKNVFSAMVSSILRAPMSYFETTPMGRILNRFTYDMDIIDVTLTQVISLLIISCSWFVAAIVILSTILPWMVLGLAPVVVVYWFLLLHYRKCATDLQRLDAMSRSPVQAMVSEGLDGSASIRVFKQQSAFLTKFYGAVDTNSSALLNFVTAQRWLGVRIEQLGSLIMLMASMLVISLNDTLRLDPGLVGLVVIWSSNFTVTLSFLIDSFGDTEAAITAIERVDAMATLPRESAMETEPSHKPPDSWPVEGLLEFEHVSLRYRAGLPLALNNLSFQIPPGSRCGVVGRTGAGKSSLTVALFRLVEIETGHIRLDGIDLGCLGLADVRGRPNGMAIIPQDPFLTGSTLRECLDPFGQHSNIDIEEALETVRFNAAQLDSSMEEGGTNFSVGERQLLNLARQLLSKPKLLVLDESTASIDGETDAFIQHMLRTRFRETTLLTIAHRLNTIMDYDLILVMDEGRAVEFGSPGVLLERGGVFSELVDATGPESSKALRLMIVPSNDL